VSQPPATTTVSSGNGSFTASLVIDTLTTAITGQMATGETCQITGTLVGTR